MVLFGDFLSRIAVAKSRARTEEVLNWVGSRYPNLKPRVAWNQPMFTDHGTFIIGFSVAKNHLSIAPERAAIDQFSSQIILAGYEHSRELFRISWDKEVDYSLLERIIEFNIAEKAGYTSFWRKST